MEKKRKTGRLQITLFFLGFVVLFVLTFTLGIIIGKGLGDTKYIEVEREPRTTDEIPVVADDTPVIRERAELPEPRHREDLRLKEDLSLNESMQKDPVREREERVVETTGTEKPSSEISQERTQKEDTLQTEMQVARIDPGESPQDLTAALPGIDPGGNFTVQLASFRNRQMAVDFERKLNARGYPSFIRESGSADDLLYRVRVGTFKDKEKAESYGKIMKAREDFLEEVFITVND